MNYSHFACLSKPGKQNNEDACFVNQSYAFVIDGATGLEKVNFHNDISPAEWVVNEWKTYLKTSLGNRQSIVEILEAGAILIKKKYELRYLTDQIFKDIRSKLKAPEWKLFLR